MKYTSRVVDAFGFAYELHREQVRKGSRVPYITHLMGVAATVGNYGGSESQFIAALLHDAVEDQGGRQALDQIRDRFGDEVAGYVAGCSDSDVIPKPPWRERKEEFLKGIADAPPQLKLIIAADKLYNARAIMKTLRERGNATWDLFKGGREGTLWYYGEAVRALSANWSHPILEELAEAVDALHRMVLELDA